MNITLKAKEFGVPLDEAIEYRRTYLNQLLEKRSGYSRLLPGARGMDRAMYLLFVASLGTMIEIIQAEIKNAEWSLNAKEYGGVTDDEIQMAREADFRHLLPNPINRSGMTRCFVHDDRHPSMKVYPNAVKCFACGKRFDAIGVAMELKGLDFKQAVKYLIGI